MRKSLSQKKKEAAAKEQHRAGRKVTIIRDLTERKRAEKEIQNLAKFPAENPNPILRIAQDGTLLYINEAGLNLLPEWHLHVGQAASPMLREAALQTMDRGSPQMVDFEHGQQVYSFSIAPIVGEGYANLYARNVTERTRAEETLRVSEERHSTILRTAMDGFWRLDLQGRLLEVNEVYCRMSGYSEQELLAMSIPDLEASETPADTAARLQRVAVQSEDRFESRHRRKDGSSYAVEIRVQYKPTEGGYLVAYLRDITKHKRAEDELRQSREQLRALTAHLESARENERTRIARELHDELGQVLTALKIDLDWIIRRLRKDDVAIIAKADIMGGLIDSTIDTVRRISSQLRPGLLDDMGLVAAMEWQTKEFAGRAGLEHELALGDKDIVLDEELATALFRIFQEMLTNVVRHADATRIRVSLDAGRDGLALTVADDGKGITESQVSDPSSLGLMGMRERIRAWGGDVLFRSVAGQGTTVTARIPWRP